MKRTINISDIPHVVRRNILKHYCDAADYGPIIRLLERDGWWKIVSEIMMTVEIEDYELFLMRWS